MRPLDITRIPLQTMKDLVEYFIKDDNRSFQTKNDHRVTVINAAVILDTLWQARNKAVHNFVRVDIQGLVASYKARVNDHLMA